MAHRLTSVRIHTVYSIVIIRSFALSLSFGFIPYECACMRVYGSSSLIEILSPFFHSHSYALFQTNLLLKSEHIITAATKIDTFYQMHANDCMCSLSLSFHSELCMYIVHKSYGCVFFASKL